MTATLATQYATTFCAGCSGLIRPGQEHLEHTLPGLDFEVLRECLQCAARNGRPGYAEPDVAEQPTDLRDVGA